MSLAAAAPRPPSPADRVRDGVAQASAAHRALRGRLIALDRALHAAGLSPRIMAPWSHLVRGMHDHMRCEETVVFPALVALTEGRPPEEPGWEEALHDMRFEADEVATITDATRSAAPDAGPHEDALLALLDELEAHSLAEQEQLYPAVMALLEQAGEVPGRTTPPPLQPWLEAELGQPVRLVPLGTLRRDGAAALHAARLDGALPVPEGMPEALEGPQIPRFVQAGVRRVVLHWTGDAAALGTAVDRLAAAGLRAVLWVASSAVATDTVLAAVAPMSGLDTVVLVSGHHGPVARLASAQLDPETARRLDRVIGALQHAMHSPRVADAAQTLLRRGPTGLQSIAAHLDLDALSHSVTHYHRRSGERPHTARAALLASFARHVSQRETARMVVEAVRRRPLFPDRGGALGPCHTLRVVALGDE